MNKKVIIGTVAISLLAMTLFAANKSCANVLTENKGVKSYHKKSSHSKKFSIYKVMKSLNLSSNQEDEIKTIVSKYKNNKSKISDAFTKTAFDKDKYIQITSQKRDNMIKSKANMIEEIYSVLTAEQKLQLKVLMDVKMSKKMIKGFNSDKNSYVRG